MKKYYEEIILAVIAVGSVFISLLDFFGILDKWTWLVDRDRIPTMALLLLGGIAIYLVIERRTRLDRLENLLLEEVERTITSLNGVSIKILDERKELYDYIARRVDEAKSRIDDLSWGPASTKSEIMARTENDKRAFTKYSRAISRVSAKKGIQYREIMVFSSLFRLERAEFTLNKKPFGYHLRYYEINENQGPPRLGFMVIDSEEVILISYRRPILPVDGEFSLAVKHPGIARLFQDYYNTIWHGAKEIKEGDRINWDTIENIRRRLADQQS